MPDASRRLKAFLEGNVIEVIYFTGPRGDKEPKLQQFIIKILNRVFDLRVASPSKAISLPTQSIR
jgi:hypothetical protein